MQDRPLDAWSAASYIADPGAAFARGLADLRGLMLTAEMTAADAFAILRQRTGEALPELRAGSHPRMDRRSAAAVA